MNTITAPITITQNTISAPITLGGTVDLPTHIADLTNPHSVTKLQLNLGNVDDTSDLDKPISTATQVALDLKAPIANPVFTGSFTSPGIDDNANATAITIDSSENVGINDTAPSYPLSVKKDGTLVTGGWYDTARFLTTDGSKGFSIGYDSTTNTSILSSFTASAVSSVLFKTYSGSAWNDSMIIAGSGNVGIGTTGPTARLEVQSPGSSQYVMYMTPSTGSGFIGLWEGVGGKTELDVVGSDGVTGVVLNTNGASYFTGGNLGIGTTAPGQALHVAKSGGATLALEDSGAITDHRLFDIVSIGGQLRFRAALDSWTSATNWLVVDRTGQNIDTIVFPNGEVGIGTTDTKGEGLSIGTTDATAWVSPGGLNNYLSLAGTGSAGAVRIFAGGVSDGLRSNTQRMHIGADGNVGIGTTTPATKLDVSTLTLASSTELTVSSGTSGTNNNAIILHTGSADTSAADYAYIDISSTGGKRDFSIRQNNIVALLIKSTGVLNIANVPTSSAGLVSGDVWSNSGVLTIVP